MGGLPNALAAAAIGIKLGLSGGTVLAMGTNDNGNTEVSLSGAYDRAVKEVERKNYRKAIRILTDVLSDEPRSADALNYMGYSHRKLGKFPKAVGFYMRALKIDPDHRGANAYLGEAYLALKNLPKAEERLAHLWNICGQNCAEYHALNRSVMDYKQGRVPDQSSRARRW